jgi:hypothetical protein
MDMTHQMSALRKSVRDYLQASEKLLALEDLTDDEERAVKEMLYRLTTWFPDTGDDAAD